MDDDDALLTPHEVALALKVSDGTAYRLMIIGKLPWVDVGTGSSRPLRRVRRSTLRAFVQNEKRSDIGKQMQDIRRAIEAIQNAPEW